MKKGDLSNFILGNIFYTNLEYGVEGSLLENAVVHPSSYTYYASVNILQ